MNRRTATAGKTRTCPHCRAIILESAAICPACRHHLRFDARSQVGQAEPGEVALRIEGSFAAPAAVSPPSTVSIHPDSESASCSAGSKSIQAGED